MLVARQRWAAVLGLGLGAVAATVILRTVVHRVVDAAPDVAARPGGRAAIAAIVGGATTGLLRLAALVLLVAAVAAVIAVLRRGRRRADLVAVAAVLAFVAVLAVLGFSLGALVAAVVLAVLVPVAAARFPGSAPGPREPARPAPAAEPLPLG